MTEAELITLAARVEAATGPDRELDADISAAIGTPVRSRRTAGGKNKGREWFVDSHGGVETWSHHPVDYTASIDAALSLLPEGRGWSIHYPSVPDSDNLPSARVWGTLHRTTAACAATPALALTAAILRALSEEMNDVG